MPIPLYSIKGLFVSKGGEDKLTIKQFDIHRGACYVFEGQMGSGKTTFLDILYSRRKTPRGEVKFEESFTAGPKKNWSSYLQKTKRRSLFVITTSPKKATSRTTVTQNPSRT